MAFNLDDYEPVADRIERFWKDHPAGRILTDLIHFDEKRFIVKATVWSERLLDQEQWTDLPPSATGFAEEIIGSTNVNRTSALENCETSAIGRALANLGYAVKNRASREEMVKAQPEPRPRSGGRKVTPTPESQENHKKAPQTDLTADVAGRVKELKNYALKQLGDIDKAKAVWEKVIGTFEVDIATGLPNAASLDFIESDLSIAVGEALTEELVKP